MKSFFGKVVLNNLLMEQLIIRIEEHLVISVSSKNSDDSDKPNRDQSKLIQVSLF
jgi:hypothetical protein